MDVAGEHNLSRTYAAGRSNDALTHARWIERNRRRLLKNTGACLLRQRRKTERIVVWIDVKRLEIVRRVEIVRAMQLFAYASRRPEFDVSTDPAHALDLTVQVAGVVGLRHVWPAIDQIDSGHLRIQNRTADVLEPL